MRVSYLLCTVLVACQSGSGDDAPPIETDAPAIDAPAIDAPPIDAPPIDAPPIDAPAIDAPAIDAPAIDAPPIDAPAIDAAAIDAPPPIDAPIDAPVCLDDFDLVDGLDDVGAYNAIATDAALGVHVVYQDWTDHAFRYAYKPHGGTWTGETISTGDYMGWDSDLAVDAAGGVHVSFSGVHFNDLYYGYRAPGGGWTLSTVDGDTSDDSNAIAVAADGTVHISYIAGQPGAGPLMYATRPPAGTWTRLSIGLTADKYDDTTIHVNPAGVVRILYGDSPADAIRLAQRLTPTAQWTVQTVTSNGSPGYSSLAVDAADGLHISFYRFSTGAMHYGYRPASGTWTTWQIDNSGLNGTGLWTEIAVEPATGRAHIVYYEAYDELRYATGIHGGAWSTQTLSSISSVGQYSSIAVDAARGVHVSYYDSLNQNLEYLYLCPS